jgi:uncharacterized membrane protein
MANAATIKIKRTGSFTASIQSLVVYLDGQKIGNISNDETASFTVEQGQHSIFVKGTFGGKTQKIDFHISSGETKDFECGIPLSYNLVFVILFIYIAIDSFVLRHLSIRNYVSIGMFLVFVLFAIYGLLVPGSCYYLKEAYDLQGQT